MVQYLCIHLSRGIMTWQSGLWTRPSSELQSTLQIASHKRTMSEKIFLNIDQKPLNYACHFYKAEGQDRDLEPHSKDFPHLPHVITVLSQSIITTVRADHSHVPLPCHCIIGYTRKFQYRSYQTFLTSYTLNRYLDNHIL